MWPSEKDKQWFTKHYADN